MVVKISGYDIQVEPEGFAADWRSQIFCPGDRKYAKKATAVAGSKRIFDDHSILRDLQKLSVLNRQQKDAR